MNFSRIEEVCLLHGEFKLRSGTIAEKYFDKYLFESDPKLLNEVAGALMPLVPDDIDFLAGMELGGIPIATALSLSTGIPQVFVRKERKTYGTCKLAEGGDIAGKRLLIVEDVVSTGGAILDGLSALREEGAIVEHALCVICRNAKAFGNLGDHGLELSALFTPTLSI